MNVNIISIVLTAVAVGSISYFVVSADRARNHEQIHHEEVTVENPYDMANAEHANANPTAQLTESDIEKIVESYIKTNPTVILKSLEDYYADQAKKAKLQQQEQIIKLKDDIYNNINDPFIGNSKGKIKLVEFFDYNCGYCAMMSEVTAKLIAEHPDLQIIMKEMPILGASSMLASKASMAVNIIDQSHYMAFHHKLLLAEDKSEANIFNIAESLGIDVLKLQEAMQRPEISDMIQHNLKLANDLQLHGTPAFILEDQLMAGAIKYETLNTAISKIKTAAAINETPQNSEEKVLDGSKPSGTPTTLN